MKKITRKQLNRILADHRLWLDSNRKIGMRADLRGADLRGAQVPLSIRDCHYFHSAKFSPDALPWLILHPKWPKWKGAVQIAAE